MLQKAAFLKEIERRLVSELMKNSHRSDRELAKALAVSQPTVTRVRAKLEKEGVIKEYTILPDFRKIGYSLMAITLVKLKPSLTSEMTEKARETARESLRKESQEVFMLERGIGLSYDGALLSLHEGYDSYLDLKRRLAQFDFLNVSETQSFLIDLNDEIHYRPLTLATLAKHLLTLSEPKSK
jgi:DNA-binding Lrp family transcriptional regulator